MRSRTSIFECPKTGPEHSSHARFSSTRAHFSLKVLISVGMTRSNPESRDKKSLLPLEPLFGSLVAFDERHELFRAGPVVLDDPVLIRAGHQRPVNHPRLDRHLRTRVHAESARGESGKEQVGGGLTMVRRSKPNHLRSPNCRLVLTSLTTRTLSRRIPNEPSS